MLILRPVTMRDHPDLLLLAREAGIGMTSLPADSHVLEKKILRAEASFAGAKSWAGDEAFLFVMEDTELKKAVASTGIVAHVGLKSPFYSYKVSTIVQASTELDIYSLQRVLHMVNDYTGVSEVGSLFLSAAYRRDGLGRFLSRCRFLMMAEFPELFANVVISEIRGVQDEAGESPFYKNLAQHFFQMPFARADFINATQGGQFISDLMPKYPVYINLLDAKAQAVIGQPHHVSLAAKQMLEAEGFRYLNYVDVFDAGPTLAAERASIRTVRRSQKLPITAIRPCGDKATHMLATTELATCRMAYAPAEITDSGVVLNEETAAGLKLKTGDMIRISE